MLCWAGLKILSVYTSGSQNMAYDSLNLTTPNIHWLGVRPSDLEKYNIPDACRLEVRSRRSCAILICT
jgi:meiotic recombination protein SPO11